LSTLRPNAPINGTGYVALKDWVTLWLERLEIFFNRRFEDIEAKTTLALAGADKAVIKAEVATEKRFQEAREESSAKFDNIEKDIGALSKEIQQRRDKDIDRSTDAGRFTRSWVFPVVILGFIQAATLFWVMFHK
jgi:hypothetical protein